VKIHIHIYADQRRFILLSLILSMDHFTKQKWCK